MSDLVTLADLIAVVDRLDNEIDRMHDAIAKLTAIVARLDAARHGTPLRRPWHEEQVQVPLPSRVLERPVPWDPGRCPSCGNDPAKKVCSNVACPYIAKVT